MSTAAPDAVLAEARALIARGALADAHKVLVAHLQKHDSADGYLLLSQIFEASGHLPQAEECFLHILRGAPEQAAVLKGLAEFYDRNKASQQSRVYWQRYVGLHPGDLLAAMSYAEHILDDSPDEAVSRLEDVLTRVQADDLLTLKVLQRLIVAKERRERAWRGLMAYHAHSLDDMFFRFAAEDVHRFCEIANRAVARTPEKKAAYVYKAIGQFVSGHGQALEAMLAPAREEVGALPFMNMRDRDGGFYESLAAMGDADILRGLPPVETLVSADFSDAPIVFLSSDGEYFSRYAVPLLRSMGANGKGTQVHVHIMDPTETQREEATRVASSLGLVVAVTTEMLPATDNGKGNRATNYFHAVRFIRFYEALKRYRRPLWLMDVDVMFNRPPADLFATLGREDAAFRARPARWEPWHQFNACVIGAAPSIPSLEYFRVIAAYIAYFHQAAGMTWGIDQLAMYAVFDYLRSRDQAPAIALLDDRAIDYDSTESGIVWADSGKSKHRAITPLAAIDPPTARYRALFQRYQKAD